MRTRDLDQAVEAVSEVYCNHRVHVVGPPAAVVVTLNVIRPTKQSVVELSYGTPVRIDAGNFPRLFLMMHCLQGAARTRQGERVAEWKSGQTLPFSAGLDTELWFNGDFVQRGMRLDVDHLEQLCSRWLGHPLEDPLRFALQPFSSELEQIWQRTLAYIVSMDEGGSRLTTTSRAALDEYLLTLLLHHHPHNYSAELAEPVRTPVPGVVRRAERFMQEHADTPVTVSDVAASLGVSLRSLQQGFRQWRSTTPGAYLRQVRLQRVRDDLLRPDSGSTVTTVAQRHGFAHLGRFSAYYRSAFGEAPSMTWRRAQRLRSIK